MKVLITSSLFPPDIGGPATYVPIIAEALSQRGHTVCLVAPQEPEAPSQSNNTPYQLVRFNRSRTLRFFNYFLENWRAFTSILRPARNCQIIFSNGLNLPAYWASRLLAKPLVVKVTGDGAWEFAYSRRMTQLELQSFQKAESARFTLLRKLHHFTPKRADAVIVPSRYLASILSGWGIPTSHIHVIYNSVCIPAPSNHLQIPSIMHSKFRIFVIGRITPIKRIDKVISILSELENAGLIIVGNGPEGEQLRALVKQFLLEDKVYFTGALSNNDVLGLLKEYAHVLVLNSVHETFPHTLLEAGACGIPVIATNVGGIPEIISDGVNGLLIPPDEPKSLVNCIRRLQKDENYRKELGVGGMKLSSKFSLEKMVTQTEQVLYGAMR